eukprot:TRINITY_DN51987_c0_g1_i1.p1 TRINITY_DN51987_c0_g1~~TRINITY_DN51987_c0_g1_i1.p1  ORF type:complete len:465 (-),score=89.20 TRINITY_DN51987_c0_g1_i1:42-1436(-)
MGNRICDACCGEGDTIQRVGSGIDDGKGTVTCMEGQGCEANSSRQVRSESAMKQNSSRSMLACCTVDEKDILEDSEVMGLETEVFEEPEFDWSKDQDFTKQKLTDDDIPRILRHLEAGSCVMAAGNEFTHAGRLSLVACASGKIELEPADGLRPIGNLNTRSLLDLSREARLTEVQCSQLLDLLTARRNLSLKGHVEALVGAATRRTVAAREAAVAAGSSPPARLVLHIVRSDKKKLDHMQLDLSKKNLTDDDLPWLKIRLAEAQPLVLSGNSFSSKARAELVRCAKSAGGNTDIDMELATGLEPPVKKLASAQRIVLASNCFGGKCLGSEGCSAIAPALAELTQLEVLELRDNYIGLEGMKILAPALRCLTQLQHLGMGMNSLGDAGAEEMIPVLREMKELHTLGLDFNNIGKEGAFALAPALSRLGKLQNLYLFGNDFKKETMDALGPTLDRLQAQGCECSV